MRFTHLELDLYRPTHIFPLLPHQRLLLLARTLLSASMMLLYRYQAGAPMAAVRCAAQRPGGGHEELARGEAGQQQQAVD